MDSPEISLVMPCYQNGETLERTVRSILAQTFTDWELIAVDDGSTDDTGARLDALAKDEPRMRVLHQENGGVSAARNAGMACARGRFIGFVDADDHLLPGALKSLLALTDEQTDIACAAYLMRHGEDGGREELSICKQGDRIAIYESLLRGDSALNSMCARLYRADMLKENRVEAPLGVKVGEDVLFNLDAFACARGWRMSPEVVYVYELGGDSAMMRARSDRYARSLPMLEGIGRFIDREHLQTALFRAHIDAYLRVLRADRGRLRAALGFDRAVVRRITKGVSLCALCGKQRLYYVALRLLPPLSFFLP